MANAYTCRGPPVYIVMIIQAVVDSVQCCHVAVSGDCITDLAACQAVRNITEHYILQYTFEPTSASMGRIQPQKSFTHIFREVFTHSRIPTTFYSQANNLFSGEN